MREAKTHRYDAMPAAAGVAWYLAGVDVGKRGAPSAVAEAVLHDGGAEEHEEGTASKHRRPATSPEYSNRMSSSSSSSLCVSPGSPIRAGRLLIRDPFASLGPWWPDRSTSLDLLCSSLSLSLRFGDRPTML